MIGFAFTTASPGSRRGAAKKGVVGNNPPAWAVPTQFVAPRATRSAGRGRAIFLDIALSVVAGNRLDIYQPPRRAASRPGWALDKNGEPTTDANAANDGGTFAPVGDYKGSGMAIMMSMITSFLAGAAFDDVRDGKIGTTNHWFAAYDVEPVRRSREVRGRDPGRTRSRPAQPATRRFRARLRPGRPGEHERAQLPARTACRSNNSRWTSWPGRRAHGRPVASARRGTLVNGHVEILRDRAGVPHIFADATGSAYFGLGFAMAEDRLWQMDRLRRRALGRQAEILGAGCPGRPDASRRRHPGHRRTRGRTDRRAPRATCSRASSPASIATSTHRASCRPSSTPGLRARAFKSRDSSPSCAAVVVAQRPAVLAELGRGGELSARAPAGGLPGAGGAREPHPAARRALPTGRRASASQMGMSDNSGSNNWAIAGDHTSAGQGNPVRRSAPAVLGAVELVRIRHPRPGRRCRRRRPSGVPGLWWGSNGAIAWGITNNAASTRDLYREQVHPTDPDLYRDGDTWRPFEEAEVEIHVRGQPRRAPYAARDRPRSDRQPRPAHRRRGERAAHRAALGRPGAPGRRARGHRASVAPAIGTASAPRCATGRWPCSTSAMPMPAGRVGYQCAGRVPVRGRVRAATATPTSRTMPGGATSRSRPCRARSTRRAATWPAPTSASRPTITPIRCTAAGAAGIEPSGSARRSKASQAFDRDAASRCRTTCKSCRAERLCPPLVDALGRRCGPSLLRASSPAGTIATRSTAPRRPSSRRSWTSGKQRVLRARFPERLAPCGQANRGSPPA